MTLKPSYSSLQTAKFVLQKYVESSLIHAYVRSRVSCVYIIKFTACSGGFGRHDGMRDLRYVGYRFRISPCLDARGIQRASCQVYHSADHNVMNRTDINHPRRDSPLSLHDVGDVSTVSRQFMSPYSGLLLVMLIGCGESSEADNFETATVPRQHQH